jgi:hypothetical protein
MSPRNSKAEAILFDRLHDDPVEVAPNELRQHGGIDVTTAGHFDESLAE